MSKIDHDDLLYRAWCLIANAGRGDWTTEGPDWHWAAARWRDDWHRHLDASAEGGDAP